ncbi:biotin-dependent carboxyltransferase family protein [Curtobacterium sp. VKM Ac-1393]|uniref:5-oxoprolinase subunit C family protein n=1 Tax=Curtobacterium sp. VKM Ac-1393 TaxID=2783814 RepID=UPI00188CBCE5|nr:biotin-dependent carboxyltransferase family protein [Curtobacterium sp. VKM Ac-1393]MBF4609451.1 biotin-dependent carboxyltransferase family protein [Curtobacterium sp. VKM Ac-1393]
MSREVRLDVVDAGWLTTFQDAGRTGTERLGVPTGGSADQHAATVANVLVGNARRATLFEVMGEFSLVPSADVLVAVTGAVGQVLVGEHTADAWTPIVVPAGVEVRVLPGADGARSYLAVAGRVHAETFLGSAAPDARMGFAQQIAHGASIAVTTEFTGFRQPHFDHALFRLPVPIRRPGPGPWTVDLLPGPAARIPGIEQLIGSAEYRVTERSNHVGVRLDGPVLHPEGDAEIVSHGVPVGAVEIPHGDELIVLGRYRTVTAGYPIVAFATTGSQSLLGQVTPGRVVRFRWVDRGQAQRSLWQAETAIQTLELAVADVFSAVGIPRHRDNG